MFSVFAARLGQKKANSTQNQSSNSEPTAEDTQPEVPGFPQSILSVSREEIDHEQLTIKKGLTEETTQLPEGLTGHVFIIGPAGSISSFPGRANAKTTLPARDGWTPLFNGDGMIYRLDFEQGAAHLKTSFVKTPCYYADLATHNDDKYQDLRFQDVGITRMAWSSLGVRNQLNTAFVPVQSAQDQHERLFVTWDVGRPYEIDPVTLDVVAPLGWNDEWRELTALVKVRPFKQVMTAAHPGYDPTTHELFTVNIGKSLSTLMGLSRSISARLKKQRDAAQIVISEPSSPFSGLTNIINRIFAVVVWWLRIFEKVVKWFATNDFVYIMRCDTSSSHITERWKVSVPGQTLRVEETLHQIGLTKDYLVLADTSFKLVLEHFLPYQKSQLAEDAKVLLADLLDYPQLDITKLYIVRRDDLKPSRSWQQTLPQWLQKIIPTGLPTVTAQTVELPFEMAHYLVDYDNPQGKITLHVTHNCATDPAEYIRLFDRSVYDDRDGTGDYEEAAITADVQRLAGTVVGPMDVSRLAGYVIDVETGTLADSDYAYSLDHNWSTALYAYRDQKPTRQFQDIYWSSWGCWPDTLTKRNFEAYQDYKKGAKPGYGRILSKEEVLKRTKKGVPSSLCHLHIERKQEPDNRHTIKLDLKTDNCYSFPSGYLGTSPQFVPRKGSTDSTDGYLVSVVLYSNEPESCPEGQENNGKPWSQNSEIWIFNAQALSKGPICRLSHSRLNFGFTLHTTWLQEIAAAPPAHDYDIREDHDPLIQDQPGDVKAEIQALFEAEIYPRFESRQED